MSKTVRHGRHVFRLRRTCGGSVRVENYRRTTIQTEFSRQSRTVPAVLSFRFTHESGKTIPRHSSRTLQKSTYDIIPRTRLCLNDILEHPYPTSRDAFRIIYRNLQGFLRALLAVGRYYYYYYYFTRLLQYVLYVYAAGATAVTVSGVGQLPYFLPRSLRTDP